MSLAEALNLKRYDPSELQTIYRCTRCGQRLVELSHKRCKKCREAQSKYMHSYRTSLQLDLNKIGSEKQVTRTHDDEFDEFLKLISLKNDISKLTATIVVPQWVISSESNIDIKKNMIKVHYLNRILTQLPTRFIIRSSCTRGGKLYFQYHCVSDTKNRKSKREKIDCKSSLTLALDLKSNQLNLKFNHKYHADV